MPLAAPFEPGTSLQQLTPSGTFSNIAGLVTDDRGDLYFTDSAMHTVGRWNATQKSVDVLAKSIETPVALGYARQARLLVIDFDKAIYELSTTGGSTEKLSGSDPRPGTSLMLPVGFHNDMGSLQRVVAHQGYVYASRSNMALMRAVENEPRSFFYPAGSDIAVMAGGSWKGLLQGVQLTPVKFGETKYAVSEEDDKVYRIKLDSLNQMSVAEFVSRSGTSVVTNEAGNVYVAGAQVFIYSSQGMLLGTLEVPERPGSLAFGGADRRTLYIGARSSLYSARKSAPGQ